MKRIQRRSEAREGRQSDAGRSRREMRGDGWGSLGMRALYDFICWEPGTKRLKQKPHHWLTNQDPSMFGLQGPWGKAV